MAEHCCVALLPDNGAPSEVPVLRWLLISGQVVSNPEPGVSRGHETHGDFSEVIQWYRAPMYVMRTVNLRCCYGMRR